jgi:hypothetical protein
MVFLGVWHYRYLLWPMSGTTTLKVIAYGFVPLVLALIGLHFASEAITSPRRRNMWRAFLILFTTAGIALTIIVEKRIDDEHATEIGQQKQAINNLIGGMNDLTGTIIHSPVDQEHQQIAASLTAIQGKLNIPRKAIATAPPARPLSTEERIHVLSDADLKSYAIQLANRIRNFEATYRANEYSQSIESTRAMSTTDPQERRRLLDQMGVQFMRQSVEHENQYKQQYWADVASVYMELIDRIKAHGKIPPEIPGWEPGGVRMTLSNGTLSGSMRVDDIANYLEILAKALTA